jgi:type VII secretion protein EccB
MAIRTVSDADVHGVPVGAPFGILGAPDAVPTAAGLAPGAWSGCALTPGNGANPATVLDVGKPVPVNGLTADQGVLVTGPDRTGYLLWGGRRLRVVAGHGVTQALGYAAVASMPVTAAFLDAVPQGPDLVAPAVDGTGGAGPTLAGRPRRIGQLFADSAGRHYVLTSTGLVPLGATVFALLSGEPATQLGAYGGAAVTTPVLGPADLAAHTAPAEGPLSAIAAALPTAPPRAVTIHRDDAVCVTLRPGAGAVSDGIGTTTMDSVLANATPPGGGTGVEPSCTPVDLVAVPPGTGALVSAAPAGGGTGRTDYLVTDSGVRYPVPAPSVLILLGYSATSQVTLPATVLALLPTGPSLDPAKLVNGGVVVPPRSPPGCA